MKNLLKVGRRIINLDQLTHVKWVKTTLTLYFAGSVEKFIRFRGDEAEAVWAELERRSDTVGPVEFEVETIE